MSKVSCNTHRMSIVTSSLMGIIFGSAIVYILSRMVAANRRIACLEQHVTKKADEEVVDGLTAKVASVELATSKVLSGLSARLDDVIHTPQPVPQVPEPRLMPHVPEERLMPQVQNASCRRFPSHGLYRRFPSHGLYRKKPRREANLSRQCANLPRNRRRAQCAMLPRNRRRAQCAMLPRNRRRAQCARLPRNRRRAQCAMLPRNRRRLNPK
jgi:hypothetical protein